MNNIEDDEFEYEEDDEEFDEDETNYDERLLADDLYIDDNENKFDSTRKKRFPLPPLYLDEEASSSSANLSSEEPSPISEINKINMKQSAKLNPLTNNKFVCIEFPLNNRQSLTEAVLIKNQNFKLDASTSLNRFHSFRLNDKLIDIEESNLAGSSNLSKSYLDLTKSDDINDLQITKTPQPIKVDLNKFEFSKLNSQMKQNDMKTTVNKSRTATVVISLRQSIKRKDSNSSKIKNTKTDKQIVNKDIQEDNIQKRTKNLENEYNKLPIIELSKSNFCDNLLSDSSESSSSSNSKTAPIICSTGSSTSTTISSSSSFNNESKKSNSKSVDYDKKVAVAANANLLSAASSSVSGLFNNNYNYGMRNKSIESSITALSQAKQLVRIQPKSFNDINNNNRKQDNFMNKENLKRVEANYLNLDSLSTIDITINKKKQQQSSLLLLLKNNNNNRVNMNISDESISDLIDNSQLISQTTTPDSKIKTIEQANIDLDNKRERCDSGVGGSLTRDIR